MQLVVETTPDNQSKNVSAGLTERVMREREIILRVTDRLPLVVLPPKRRSSRMAIVALCYPVDRR